MTLSRQDLRSKFTPGTRVRWAAYSGQRWRSGTVQGWEDDRYIVIEWDGVERPDRRLWTWVQDMDAMDLLDELASL